MNDVRRVRKFLFDVAPVASEAGGKTSASVCMDRIEAAIRSITAQHGSQCQCAGCAVLRETP